MMNPPRASWRSATNSMMVHRPRAQRSRITPAGRAISLVNCPGPGRLASQEAITRRAAESRHSLDTSAERNDDYSSARSPNGTVLLCPAGRNAPLEEYSEV